MSIELQGIIVLNCNKYNKNLPAVSQFAAENTSPIRIDQDI
jgi:hypothetical protein